MSMERHFAEPLLDSDGRRFVLFPLKYRAIWNQYKSLAATFWTVDNIQLKDDIESWNSQTADETKRITSILLAITGDGHPTIHIPLTTKLSAEISSLEARCYLGFQNMSENIHAEAISLLRLALIHPERSYDPQLLARKLDWASQYTLDSISFPERLVALAAVKAIFTSSCLCLMTYFGEHLDGLTYILRRIGQDLEHHSDFAVILFHHVQMKPSQDRLTDIVVQAVQIEKSFVTDVLKIINTEDEIWSVTANTMSLYIEYLADVLIFSLGYDKIFHVDNPMPFMPRTSAEEKKSYIASIMESAYTSLHSHAIHRHGVPAETAQIEEEDF